MPLPIVSFYNDVDGRAHYSACAKRLAAQCDALAIEHYIIERQYGDNWIANVKAKPTFLREMYERMDGPFLWVDVDCDVLQYPHDAEALSCEWACVPRVDQELPVCDCVHLVGRSPRTRALLDAWIEQCAHPGTRGSHSGFCSLLPHAVRDGLQLAYLPQSYVAGPVVRLGLAETDSKTSYLRAMTCK